MNRFINHIAFERPIEKHTCFAFAALVLPPFTRLVSSSRRAVKIAACKFGLGFDSPSRSAKATTTPASTESPLALSALHTPIHVHIHEYTRGTRFGYGWTAVGGGGEFVIVIARRGRAAIAITPRRRSYRRAGLLRPVPTYLRSYSPTPPTPDTTTATATATAADTDTDAASIPARSTSPDRLVFSRQFAPSCPSRNRKSDPSTLNATEK